MLDFIPREGFWTDHERGKILGKTLTLSSENSFILFAFIATFIGLVGTRFWVILAYIIHQAQSNSTFKTIFYHQNQIALRNSASPWQIVCELSRITWAWRSRRKKRSILRAILLMLVATCSGFLFLAASTLSPRLITGHGELGTSYALVKGGSCGFEHFDLGFDGLSLREGFAQLYWTLQKYSDAQSYVEDCYVGDRSASACNILPAQVLSVSVDRHAKCPFEPELCDTPGKDSLKMDTGKISSRSLGLNIPLAEEVYYRKVLTCAPLNLRKYTELVEGPEMYDRCGVNLYASQLYKVVSIGPKQVIGRSTPIPCTAFRSPSSISEGFGYSVETAFSYDSWLPLPAFNQSNGDVSVLFVFPNSVRFSGKVNDPVFKAHEKVLVNDPSGVTAQYFTTKIIGNIACVHEYAICGADDSCATLGDIETVWASQSTALTWQQNFTIKRLYWLDRVNTFAHVPRALGANSLLANKMLIPMSWVSPRLPDNQWQLEMLNYFNITLARLQIEMAEFAAQPFAAHGQLENKTDEDAIPQSVFDKQCENQKIRIVGQYESFRVMNLAAVLVVGSLVITLSICIESVGGFIQRLIRVDPRKRDEYNADSYIELQRQGLENAGVRDWSEKEIPVPTSNPLLARRKDLQTGRMSYIAWNDSELMASRRKLLADYGVSVAGFSVEHPSNAQ